MRNKGRPRDEEIDEELRSHIELAADDGGDRAAARRELGNVAQIKQDTRAVWRNVSLDRFVQDLRVAVRGLRRSPGFAVTVVVLIAIGVGVNGQAFLLFHSMLHRPLATVTAENLVSLGVARDGVESDPGNSWLNYLDYVESSRTLRNITARGFTPLAVGVDGQGYAFRGALVSTNYFDGLGVRPILGRGFVEADSDGALTAIVSHRFWREQLEEAPDLVGIKILVNGYPADVVGVAPPEFRGPQLAERNDVWLPIEAYYAAARDRVRRAGILEDRDDHAVELTAQLAPGAGMEDAQAELSLISTRLAERYPETNKGIEALVRPHTAIGSGAQPIKTALALLLTVGVLLLIIIASNLANLTIFRSIRRRHEMAVRMSLGAPLGRIMLPLLVEGLLLALVAAAAGWAVARGTAPWLLSLIPTGPPALDLSIDWSVAGYTLLQAVLAVLAFAALPALGVWRSDPHRALGEREPQVGVSGGRLLKSLTVVQLAGSVVLLVGASLLWRSSSSLRNFDAGFNKDQLLFISVNTTGAATSPETHATIVTELAERLGASSGIEAVSFASYTPLGWRSRSLGLVEAEDAGRQARPDFNLVGPSYFSMLEAPMKLGREITLDDRNSDVKDIVVNENLAEALWPGESALGRTIRVVKSGELMRVIGVCANAAYSDIRRGREAQMAFLPYLASGASPGEADFYVRYSGSHEAVIPVIRATAQELNPSLAVGAAGTALKRLELSNPAQLISSTIAVFALGALALTAIGLYGLVAVSMARRKREFGIRLALGASSREVWTEAMRGGLTLSATGLALGVTCALLGSRALSRVLFGVEPLDPPTYLGVAVLLALTCLAACALPANQASRTNPANVLRRE